MTFCFRIRFHLGLRVRINSSGTQLALPSAASAETITLRPTQDGVPLQDARELVLLGRAYDTEEEATEAARRWRGLIQKALARVNAGADFGDRAPKGFWTKAGLEMLENRTERRVLNDVHGTSVFECEPQPLFARAGGSGIKGVPAERLVTTLAGAIEAGAVMSAREQAAYDLYGASFSTSSADARLALLMMAIETMIEPRPRSDAVREHVDGLIAQTLSADLPEEEIQSIVSSLEWLRSESIGQAGRRLASSVGERIYMDEPPDRFFANCYALRSRLLHGEYPPPTRPEVDRRAGSLELLVRDLLSLELLDKFPD